MKIFEIIPNPLRALTPAQARIASLKRNADNAQAILRTERDRQRRQKAAQRMKKAVELMRRVSVAAPQKRRKAL